MAKGQQRGNREIKKPKQKKDTVAAAPSGLASGVLATLGARGAPLKNGAAPTGKGRAGR